jgi:hypothetical protein
MLADEGEDAEIDHLSSLFQLIQLGDEAFREFDGHISSVVSEENNAALQVQDE